MASFKQYEKKGKKFWMFKAYTGTDPMSGKQRFTTRRGFTSKKQAQVAASRLEVQVAENALASPTDYKFKEIYEEWFKQYKPTVKEATWSTTKSLFDLHINPQLGELYVSKIDTMMCQRAMEKWSKTYPSMVRLLRSYTIQIFDFAIRLGFADKNPMMVIKAPKRTEKTKNEDTLFYDKDELTEFLKEAEELLAYKHFTFFRLLAFSGIRKGEAFALAWDDIDFTNKTLSISKTVTKKADGKNTIGSPKTKKSKRLISLDDDTLRILRKWKLQQKTDFFKIGIPLEDNQLIFASPENKLPSVNTPTNWKNDFHSRYKKKHGKEFKKITTHGFRHTHASLLFEAGASIKEVQDRLGHSDIQTTMNIYTHVSKKIKDGTGDLFANFMAKK